MPELTTSPLKASSLQFYPETGPADPDVFAAIGSLWRQGRAFLVLSGPPGVGKTRAAEDLIVEMLRARSAPHDRSACRLSQLFPNYQNAPPSSRDIETTLVSAGTTFVWEICVLHPQFTYEDMIRGVRLGASAAGAPQLSVREGVLGFMSRVVEALDALRGNGEHPTGILVLDEINRAALGQLFGEAMYALDRRGQAVATPHNLEESGCTIHIPKSLLLLGTMNSVDRAVSGFDFALKRRFVTLTMGSRLKPIEDRYIANVPLQSIAMKLYQMFSTLVRDATQSGVVPTSELVLGHSYFIAPSRLTSETEILEWIAQSIQYQMIPTLVDYVEQGLLQYSKAQLDDNPFGVFISGARAIGDLDASLVRQLLTSIAAPTAMSSSGGEPASAK